MKTKIAKSENRYKLDNTAIEANHIHPLKWGILFTWKIGLKTLKPTSTKHFLQPPPIPLQENAKTHTTIPLQNWYPRHTPSARKLPEMQD